MSYTFDPRLDGNHAVQNQLVQHLRHRADRFFTEAEHHKAALTDVAAVEQWRQRTRQVFLDAIGGLPDERVDLQPQIRGEHRTEHYVIERVIFQSLPDQPVTANLYRPLRSGLARHPAVLMLCGHARAAKAFPCYQQVCSVLARNGFVVLILDPIGQGERMQCIERDSGAQLVRWGTREHSYIGLACTLAGENLARYMVWDAMRGVDYLAGREDVDPTRIGLTGNSGGGTQSCYLMLMDDRIAAAAPGTYVSTRQHVMRSGISHDAEQNLFGAIACHLDYDDFLIGFAPRPLHLLATAYDFFPIEGTRVAYDRTRRAYAAMGAQAQCLMTVDPQTHEFTPALREAAVAFFAQVFQNRSPHQLDMEPAPLCEETQLQCTRGGQVLLDHPRTHSLLTRVARRLPRPDAIDPDSLRQKIRDLVVKPRVRVPLSPRIIRTQRNQDEQIHSEKIFFFSEPDVIVAGVYIKPLSTQTPLDATLVLLPEGTDSLSDPDCLTRLAPWWSGRRAMLVLDTRAQGAVVCEHTARHDLHRMYGPWFKLAYDAWMLGDHLAAMRAYDAMCGLEYLRSRGDVDPAAVALHAEGDLAFVGLLAAIADGQVARTHFEGLPPSYRQALQGGLYDRRILNEWTTLHGMLRHFDIPDLLALLPAGGN